VDALISAATLLANEVSRLGYQIPNYTYPGINGGDIFGNILAQAQAAEAAGFDRVFVMDHFYQLPGIGAPHESMFECYSLLSAIAQHTDTVRLSALVTGNTYRHPTLLAKTITALDHVSGGRATLGIGAGWFELEHDSLGYEFGTFTDRFEKLEEALQIVIPMLRGENVSLSGTHYQVANAINSPAPISDIPIMIGGSGEKKTLRMVAQYADESNLSSGTIEEAEADLRAMADAKGFSDEIMDMIKAIFIYGDPDSVGEELQALMDTGLDGLTINLPFNGHNTDRIGLLGEVAHAVM
jgi:F420-dependent oxidoreductase-like protein